MQHEVPRSRSRIKFGEWRIVRRKRSLRRVELIDEHLVQSKIVDEGKATIGREIDRVRMRTFLALGIRSMPGVLYKSCRFAQFSAFEYGEYRNATTSVVGDQHILSGPVDDDVAGVGAARGNLVDERQLAGSAVNGKCADSSAVWSLVVSNFVHGV